MAASPTAAYTLARTLCFDSYPAASETKLCVLWRLSNSHAQAPCSWDAKAEPNRLSSTGNNCCYDRSSLLAAISCSAPGWLTHMQHSSRELCLGYNGSARHKNGRMQQQLEALTHPLVAAE